MKIIEKIYYTWLICAIPVCLFGWVFVDENEHPILHNFMAVFIWLPIAIGLIAMFIWVIMFIWN